MLIDAYVNPCDVHAWRHNSMVIRDEPIKYPDSAHAE
jgi:hypothetical protein